MTKVSNYKFRPAQRLKTSKDFSTVFSARRKYRAKGIALYYRKNSLGFDRLGLTVSKKLGNAVVRNKIKRRIREIFRQNKNSEKPSLDLVARPESNFLAINYAEFEQIWQKSLNDIKKRLRA